MLLIVGLGNPGAEYAKNRHNVGFIAVDAIQRRHGFTPWRRRFRGEVAEGTLAGEKILLLKPLTYMNESGRAVGEAANFFKIEPQGVLVIHDEVDLPPAKIRMKTGGGSAGHNGLKSISAAIGDGYRRLRVGVGHPGVREAVPHYVLHDFAKADAEWLAPLIDAIADNAGLIAEGKDSTFANRLHAVLAPEKPGKEDASAGKPLAATAESKSQKPRSSTESAAKRVEQGPGDGPLARGLKRLFGKD